MNEKFYIRMNQASNEYWYWNQAAQNWTRSLKDVSMFDSEDDANAEAVYANKYGPGEAVVCIRGQLKT